jgi:hypothetical protein
MAKQDTLVRVSIVTSESLANELPCEPQDRSEVLRLGLREWKIREALDDYRQGRGTLAYAALRAGVSLWEIGAIAYAHGVRPETVLEVGDQELTLEQASLL